VAVRSILFAAALAMLVGCGSSSQICHCPIGGAVVTLRPELQQIVTGVTTDTCFLSSSDPTQLIYLQTLRPGDCHVSIQLANGTSLTAEVTFASAGGCCPNLFVETDGSPPMFVDGGAVSGD
jgi:hypothetical protein